MNGIEHISRRYEGEQYLALAECGILSPDDHVELLDGIIVAMAPSSPSHNGRGASTWELMKQRIEKYRSTEKRDPAGRYEIGCLMITSPMFFDEGDWVAQPVDWKGQTVQGRGEDLAVGDGARILRECLERSDRSDLPFVGDKTAAGSPTMQRFGPPVLVTPRLGQGTFRVAVTDAYARACAVTNEHSLPALEAAHIRPYAREGAHAVANGLLLRSDIHRLFDKGYVTVTSELKFAVSDRLREHFDNGKSYYPLHGKPIALPRNGNDQPDTVALAWHSEHVFLR